MIFNQHSYLEGKHAFLGASNYHWINYDDDKLDQAFRRAQAKALGTRLHDLAAEAIELGIPFENAEKTLNMYVRDCIGFKMIIEQPLFYSENAFGTADAIAYRNKTLRIFDLKTGLTKASFNQLKVYAAFFFLEYPDYDPAKTTIELRIYQGNQVSKYIPETEEITNIMQQTITKDKRIKMLKMQQLKG